MTCWRRKDVDAVIHQHARSPRTAPSLTAAVRVGKDTIIEKPLAMNMKELLSTVDTVKKSDRVVQIGTQILIYLHLLVRVSSLRTEGSGRSLQGGAVAQCI